MQQVQVLVSVLALTILGSPTTVRAFLVDAGRVMEYTVATTRLVSARQALLFQFYSRRYSSISLSPSQHQPLDNWFPAKNRFERTAATDAASDQECILEIDGEQYNLTAWAKSHPGGVQVLSRFHQRDASKAFHAVGHSTAAYAMLKDFAMKELSTSTAMESSRITTTTTTTRTPRRANRWRQKLFTKDDRFGFHKYMGIFCLAHFAFRFFQMYFGDPSAGFGTRQGRGAHIGPALCLVPHALLSLSSLIFDAVPKERVVGKPMIWKEYRVHNIVFGLRSVVCTFLAWLSVYTNHERRRLAIVGSCLTALLTSLLADWATHELRTNPTESTTATMPYWEGCSATTEKRFKLVYAYAQFMATLACIAVCNPAWSFSVLLAIQEASFLMTLVRKGFLSTNGSHMAYTVSLIMPLLAALRGAFYMNRPVLLPIMILAAGIVFQLRRWGVNKYLLWVPLYAARIVWGDQFIPYAAF